MARRERMCRLPSSSSTSRTRRWRSAGLRLREEVRPGPFKAISVNAGGGPDEAQMGYAKRANGFYVCPGGPIPTLVTHGNQDPEVEPASGDFTANCFATTNGCELSRSPVAPAPCEQHDGCPADHPVKWCLVPGLGHRIWGDAMKEAWAFFKAF